MSIDDARTIRYVSGLGEAVIIHGNRCACWRCNPDTSPRDVRIMEGLEYQREKREQRDAEGNRP